MVSALRKLFDVIMYSVICFISVVFMVGVTVAGLAYSIAIETLGKTKESIHSKAMEIAER
ncbi:hypothetical protein BWP24_28510 (plasmid) [Vibrio campbellii]|nr:hypothetical protein BWP24_27960 [Vibrio campbellii]APX10134.1 hypothetical protein BWP24_28510 [Vibrio campbellii]ARR10577.1 unknow [Vibrio campbellii]